MFGFRSTTRTSKIFPLNCSGTMIIDLSEYYFQRHVDGLDFKTNSGVTVEGLWPEVLTQELSDPWLTTKILLWASVWGCTSFRAEMALL